MAEADPKVQERMIVKARFEELVSADLEQERRSYTTAIVVTVVVIIILVAVGGAYYKRDAIMTRFKPTKTETVKAPTPATSPAKSTNKITISTE